MFRRDKKIIFPLGMMLLILSGCSERYPCSFFATVTCHRTPDKLDIETYYKASEAVSDAQKRSDAKACGQEPDKDGNIFWYLNKKTPWLQELSQDMICLHCLLSVWQGKDMGWDRRLQSKF